MRTALCGCETELIYCVLLDDKSKKSIVFQLNLEVFSSNYHREATGSLPLSGTLGTGEIVRIVVCEN